MLQALGGGGGGGGGGAATRATRLACCCCVAAALIGRNRFAMRALAGSHAHRHALKEPLASSAGRAMDVKGWMETMATISGA